MKGFIFDLDGTLYLGESMIEGAAEAVQALRDRGDRVVFLTNKPIATRLSYAEKLTKMGIPATLDDVLNSSQIVAKYLQKHMKPSDRIYVIGEEPIHEELREHGIPYTLEINDLDYVILSWDRQFTYDKLNYLYQAYMNGAKVIASNPDMTCPTDFGQIPDTGAIIAALEAITGKPIDFVAGKPSLIAAEAAAEQLGLPVESCYMVGDRLDTDIKMGNDAGMNSVLVLTGVTTSEMAEQSATVPKHIIHTIKEIVQI